MPKVKIGVVRFDESDGDGEEEAKGEAASWAKGDRVWFNGQQGKVQLIYKDGSYKIKLDDGTMHMRIHGLSLSVEGGKNTSGGPSKVGIQYISVKTHGAAAATRRAGLKTDRELAMQGKSAYCKAHGAASL
jgi:hypothetical protein